MESNPLEAKHINSVVEISIASAFFCYNVEFIEDITEFFNVQSNNEEFKEAAFEVLGEKLENAQNDLAEKAVSESVLKLNLSLASPVIVVPFSSQGGV